MTASAWGLLALFLAVLALLAWPLGRLLAALCEGRMPRLLERIEAPLYRLAGVQPGVAMPWHRYALNLMAFNGMGTLLL